MSTKSRWCFSLIFLTAVLLAIPSAVFCQEKPKAEGAAKEGTFAITRMIVGPGVENREPQGAAEKFPLDTEKVYCFLEAANIPKDTEITLVWFNGDKEIGKSNLPLKQGPKWRTWAYKNLRGLKGEWKIEARDTDGKVLKDTKFKVE